MLQTERIVGAWRNSAVSKVPPADLVLVTDFDGTLAEVVPDPAQSVALPEALQALSRLVRLIADVIVFLVSDAAAALTGNVEYMEPWPFAPP